MEQQAEFLKSLDPFHLLRSALKASWAASRQARRHSCSDCDIAEPLKDMKPTVGLSNREVCTRNVLASYVQGYCQYFGSMTVSARA